MSQVLLSLNTAIDIYYHITGSIVNAASYKKYKLDSFMIRRLL
jgi:hypothetical protein